MIESREFKGVTLMKELKLCGERIITGPGSIDYISELKGSSIFIVGGGQSVFKNGTMDKVEKLLRKSNTRIKIFRGVGINPDTSIVEAGVEAMRHFKPDTILAIGGGSPIDAAKVMAFMYEYPDISFDNILDTDISTLQIKNEFIAVPTTSGTGTEVTKAAVITFKEKNIKIGLKSEAFIPTIAILDGELTLSMPQNIVAETGLDALTHALECYTNHNLDDYTECLAKGAIEGLLRYLPISYKEGTIEARQKVHHYQNMAGMAFHNVGLGMSHGISHAFGGKYNMGHGLLNGICLPYVLEFNRRNSVVASKLKSLESSLQIGDIVERIRSLNEAIGIPKGFKETGLSESLFKKDFEELVSNSLKGSTARNPVTVEHSEMEALLTKIYYGESS